MSVITALKRIIATRQEVNMLESRIFDVARGFIDAPCTRAEAIERLRRIIVRLEKIREEEI